MTILALSPLSFFLILWFLFHRFDLWLHDNYPETPHVSNH